MDTPEQALAIVFALLTIGMLGYMIKTNAFICTDDCPSPEEAWLLIK